MGLFDSLKKVFNNDTSESKEITTKAEHPNHSIQIKTSVPKHKNNYIFFENELTFHQDVIDLLWIGDGKEQNFNPENSNNKITNDFFTITIQEPGSIEPSLIMTTLNIKKPDDHDSVERPPYFPNYIDLQPENKWMYLNFLNDPYSPKKDIGYVFLFYYGLERHLFEGNFDKAFRIILKLRNVYDNGSFQSYSSNAIILSCLYHKKPDALIEFISSIDQSYEQLSDTNLLILCLFSLGLDFTAAEIMKSSRTFEFDNTRYIRKYPDLFLDTLKKVMYQKYNKESLDLQKFFNSSKISKLKFNDATIYANLSLKNIKIKIYDFVNDFKFKKEIFDLLECTHNKIKNELSVMRKEGIAMPLDETKNKTTTQKILVFDDKKEKSFLKRETELLRNPIDLHYLYIEIQNFYYKYRDLGKKYENKCIEYCYKDINNYEMLNSFWINNELLDLNRLYKNNILSKSEYDNRKANVEQGFVYNIPAFQRLAIIFEKNKQYDKAIEICNEAISLGFPDTAGSFTKRKEKLLKKIEKYNDSNK